MKKERSHIFDLLKGVAICMVCITHFAWEDEERTALLFPFWISMAVPLFLLVTGYLTTASWERRQLSLRALYSREVLLPKAKQFLVPFAQMFAVELLLEWALHHREMPLRETIAGFLTGGLGVYGTYYVPVLMQLLLILPLVYCLLRRNPRNIIWCFLVNLLYEMSKDSLGVTAWGYRLLAVRYLFLISMGCYLYLERGKFSPAKYVPMFLTGAGYILLNSYLGVELPMFRRWDTTCMLTAFYVAPIMALLLKRGQGLRCPLLEKLGQASYQIFLVQILYYNYGRELLAVENRMLRMAAGAALCLLAGRLWFLLSSRTRTPGGRNTMKLPRLGYHTSKKPCGALNTMEA